MLGYGNSAPCNIGTQSRSDARYMSSSSFNSPPNRPKSLSKSMGHHFSIESYNFSGSALKRTANQLKDSHAISLSTGRPTSDFYPWTSLSTWVKTSFGGQSAEMNTDSARTGKHDQTDVQSGGPYDLATALNYSHGAGSHHLVRFIKELVELIHKPAYTDWATCISCGSTSALEVAFRILCNRGDTVLTEKYTYPGAMTMGGVAGVHIHGIRMDSEGLRPDCLLETLSTWNFALGSRPRVLYTIPTGQNPTGLTQSEARRRAIYKIVEDYDLIIIEDDPYYFLQLDSCYEDCHETDNNDLAQASCKEQMHSYLNNLPISYLSLDQSGRVIRLDSTSKILAPGLRAGWVTANAHIIDKFISYHDIGVGAASGPTQLMLFQLLQKSWGHKGFIFWLKSLSQEYRARRDILLGACEQHLPGAICTWTAPEYGMFVWVKLRWQTHPENRVESDEHRGEINEAAFISEIESRILTKTLMNGVQVTKGSIFCPNEQSSLELHFRLTYAAAHPSQFDGAVKAFGDVVREEFLSSSIAM